jgi:crotonobetainyl-CoA:carnitine CoA-transferase CaiB-like acyl-CoA transferase
MSRVLGKPEWATDPKYLNNSVRVQHRVELETLIESQTEQRTTKQWLDAFEGSGMPYAPVNDIMDSLEHEHSNPYLHHLSHRRLLILHHRQSPQHDNRS